MFKLNVWKSPGPCFNHSLMFSCEVDVKPLLRLCSFMLMNKVSSKVQNVIPLETDVDSEKAILIFHLTLSTHVLRYLLFLLSIFDCAKLQELRFSFRIQSVAILPNIQENTRIFTTCWLFKYNGTSKELNYLNI